MMMIMMMMMMMMKMLLISCTWVSGPVSTKHTKVHVPLQTPVSIIRQIYVNSEEPRTVTVLQVSDFYVMQQIHCFTGTRDRDDVITG